MLTWFFPLAQRHLVELCNDLGYNLRIALFASIYEKIPQFLHEGISKWNAHYTCFLAHSFIQPSLLSEWEAATASGCLNHTDTPTCSSLPGEYTPKRAVSSTLRNVSQGRDPEAFSPATRITYITFPLQTHIAIVGCSDCPNSGNGKSVKVETDSLIRITCQKT